MLVSHGAIFKSSFFLLLKGKNFGNILVSLSFFVLKNSAWSCQKFNSDRPYQVLVRPLRHPLRCPLSIALFPSPLRLQPQMQRRKDAARDKDRPTERRADGLGTSDEETVFEK